MHGSRAPFLGGVVDEEGKLRRGNPRAHVLRNIMRVYKLLHNDCTTVVQYSL